MLNRGEPTKCPCLYGGRHHPTRSSSILFRCDVSTVLREIDNVFAAVRNNSGLVEFPPSNRVEQRTYYLRSAWICRGSTLDRKSTRLNSSHSQISYAVFCLKKKIHPPRRNLPLLSFARCPTPL